MAILWVFSQLILWLASFGVVVTPVHFLAKDGTPEPTPIETPVPTPEPTPEPVAGDLRSIVQAVFPEWAWGTAMRIAMCESGGNQYATGRAGERGWFQIHPVHFDSTYDAWGNVQAAYRISAGGSNWSAWTCR